MELTKEQIDRIEARLTTELNLRFKLQRDCKNWKKNRYYLDSVEREHAYWVFLRIVGYRPIIANERGPIVKLVKVEEA